MNLIQRQNSINKYLNTLNLIRQIVNSFKFLDIFIWNNAWYI